MRGRGFKVMVGALAVAGGLAVGGAAMAAQGPAGAAPDGQGWVGHRGPGGPGGPGGPFGRGFRGPGGPGAMMLFRGLDLTDEQRQQVRGIFQQHKAEFDAVREKIRTAHEAQRAAAEATPIDEGAIRAAALAIGTAEGDLAVLGARVRAEALQVLTPEQQTKLQERKAEMEKRRAEWSQKRQQRQQNRQQPQQAQPPQQ